MLWQITLKNEALGCTQPKPVDKTDLTAYTINECGFRIFSWAPYGDKPLKTPAWIDPQQTPAWFTDSLEIRIEQEVAFGKGMPVGQMLAEIGNELPEHWFKYVAPREGKRGVPVPYVIENKKALLYVKPKPEEAK